MSMTINDVNTIISGPGYPPKLQSSSTGDKAEDKVNFEALLQSRKGNSTNEGDLKNPKINNTSEGLAAQNDKTVTTSTDSTEKDGKGQYIQQEIKKALEDSGLDIEELLILLSSLSQKQNTGELLPSGAQGSAVETTVDKLLMIKEKLSDFLINKESIKGAADKSGGLDQNRTVLKEVLDLASKLTKADKNSEPVDSILKNVLQPHGEIKAGAGETEFLQLLSNINQDSTGSNIGDKEAFKQRIIQQISELLAGEVSEDKNTEGSTKDYLGALTNEGKDTEFSVTEKVPFKIENSGQGTNAGNSEQDTITKLQNLISEDLNDRNFAKRVLKFVENQTTVKSDIYDSKGAAGTSKDSKGAKNSSELKVKNDMKVIKSTLTDIKKVFDEIKSSKEAESSFTALEAKTKNNLLTVSEKKEFKLPQENPKEEKLLDNLISSNQKGSSDKVTLMMNQLTNKTADIPETDNQKLLINRSNFTADLVKTVKFMNLNDVQELTVKIAPRELGEVIIKLTMEAGNMKANITTHNKEAYNLLSSNLQDIKQGLGNGDIRIQNVTVNIYQGDTTFFKDGSNQNNGQDSQQKKRNEISGVEMAEGETSDTEFLEQDNNINMLA